MTDFYDRCDLEDFLPNFQLYSDVPYQCLVILLLQTKDPYYFLKLNIQGSRVYNVVLCSYSILWHCALTCPIYQCIAQCQQEAHSWQLLHCCQHFQWQFVHQATCNQKTAVGLSFLFLNSAMRYIILIKYSNRAHTTDDNLK